MRTVFVLPLALLLALAGCIQAPADPNAADESAPAATTGGSMTGDETREDSSGLCDNGLALGSDSRFCATRVITVAGTIAGLSRLEIDLSTFNGDILATPGKEGTWSLVATLEARRASASEASAALNKIEFTWSHEDASGHFLQAEAAVADGEANDISADLTLTMPRSLLMELVADTSNGDVTIDGGRTDGLSLHTSNGDVVAKADVTQVDLGTSNGGIAGALKPTSSGRINAATSNGKIAIELAEDAQHGYELEGTTSNGEVEIELRDGQKGECPQGSEYYTPPCNHRTFRTGSYESRTIKSRVILTTSNGDVTVGPL